MQLVRPLRLQHVARLQQGRRLQKALAAQRKH
jgi:hypothetical protein